MPDPVRTDDGRLGRIRDLCAVAGVARLCLYLFEVGVTERDAVECLAIGLGVLPRRAPFQSLFDDPDPANWLDD